MLYLLFTVRREYIKPDTNLDRCLDYIYDYCKKLPTPEIFGSNVSDDGIFVSLLTVILNHY